jgi:hypothetical protein
MDAIRVYRYELYDQVSRGFLRQPCYATEQAIALARGVVMHSTARDVPATEVDARGEWHAVHLDHAPLTAL